METEFIPYNEALALKELGFDEPCLLVYEKFLKQLFSSNSNDLNDQPKNSKLVISITAPTFSQTFRWFRDNYKKYNIIFEIRNWNGEENQWYYIIHKDGETLPWNWIEGMSYEEAELACLIKLIEIVKSS